MSKTPSRIETVLSLSDEIRALRTKLTEARQALAEREARLTSILSGATVTEVAAIAAAPKKRGRPAKAKKIAKAAAATPATPKKRGPKKGSKRVKKAGGQKGPRAGSTTTQIVDALKAGGNKPLTSAELAKKIGATKRLQSVRSLASRLVRDGVLKKGANGGYIAA